MAATAFVEKCWEHGHKFRAAPARAAGVRVGEVRVISRKKCVDCKVIRAELEDNTVRYFWSQKDGRFGD